MKSNLKEKEAERMTELLKDAEGHPLMKQILAEKAAEVLRKRMEADGKTADLKKERDEIIPRLKADLAGKEAKYKKAKAALDAATNECRSARVALSSESHSFETEINKQREILIETAAPEIDEGIVFFNEKLNFLRSPGRISRTAGGAEKNIFTMKKTVKEESNADAVRSALAYCQAAIMELERMKLSPTLDAEKIEKMKAGVPDISVYTEVTGEKPLPRVNTDPFAGMASDSELDWRRDKLLEKTKKILKR